MTWKNKKVIGRIINQFGRMIKRFGRYKNDNRGIVKHPGRDKKDIGRVITELGTIKNINFKQVKINY